MEDDPDGSYDQLGSREDHPEFWWGAGKVDGKHELSYLLLAHCGAMFRSDSQFHCDAFLLSEGYAALFFQFSPSPYKPTKPAVDV